MKLTAMIAATALLLTGGVLGAQDLSDAPSPYPKFTFFQTSQSGYRLDAIGAGCSDDMSHGAGWTDDSDDDGVEFLNVTKGGTATIKVPIVQTGTTDDFALWMDFNNDGDWLDAGERVIWAGYSSSAPNGAFAARVAPPYGGSSTSFNSYTINIPAGAVGTSVKVRALLWDTAAHSSGPMMANGGGHPGDGTYSLGFSDWGEVEDHDIAYGVSTGSKVEVLESDGSTLGASIAHNGNRNLGNMTAGQQYNVFFGLRNKPTASLGLHFTSTYPTPTVQVSNLVNCQVNMFALGNGYYMSPGTSWATFIAMVTPTSVGSPFSFRLTMPCNDPVYPNFSWTCGGNSTSPAPNMEVHRPAYTVIPVGGTDAQGAQPAGNALNLTYTIFNNGSATLNLTGSPMVQLATPTNCTAQVTSQPPVSSLQGGGWSMQFSVSVTPTTTGQPFSVVMTIPSNDTAKSPYQITISGTAGTQSGSPEIDVLRGASIASGGTDNVGSATASVAATLNYTVSNSAGTAALNLTGSPLVQISNQSNVSASATAQPAASVAAGATTSFTVQYTPGTGAFGFRITIINNDSNESPYIIDVTGSGTSTTAPEVDLQRGGSGIADGGVDSVGTLAAGSAASFSCTVLNSGNASLTVGNVSVGTTSNCTVNVTVQPGASVNAGGSTSFTISLTPSASGAFSAALSFTNNDPNENPYDFTVSGNGQTNAPDIAVQRPVGTIISGTENLGTVAFGTPINLTYTISNTGTQPLNLTGSPAVVATPGGNCSVTASQPVASTIPAGSSATFTITLNVATAAGFSFTVSIANNVAGKDPYAWTTSGIGGTLPEIDISRTTGLPVANGGSLNLGTLPTGVTQQVGFVVFNTGNATLNLVGNPRVAISNAVNCTLVVVAQPGPTIAGGSSTTFNVSHSVLASGPFSVDVTVLNDDADEGSYSFTVNGTGGSAAFGSSGNGGGGGGCAVDGGTSNVPLVLVVLLGLGTLLWRRKGMLQR